MENCATAHCSDSGFRQRRSMPSFEPLDLHNNAPPIPWERPLRGVGLSPGAPAAVRREIHASDRSPFRYHRTAPSAGATAKFSRSRAQSRGSPSIRKLAHRAFRRVPFLGRARKLIASSLKKRSRRRRRSPALREFREITHIVKCVFERVRGLATKGDADHRRPTGKKTLRTCTMRRCTIRGATHNHRK